MSTSSMTSGDVLPVSSEAPAPSQPLEDSTGLTRIVDDLVDGVQRKLQSQRWPSATYRFQFHRGFTFRRAAELVPYLHDLGVSDVYASPYLKAASGSTHGYDIVDHSRLNPELGNAEDFHAFTAALDAHGMGHILDIVPNHMGVGTDENNWWQDVLENGRGSIYASTFDIDWSPPKSDLQFKILLPVLGEQFGQVLESGQLQLEFREGAFFIRYFNRRFPVAPKSFGTILRHRLNELVDRSLPDDPHFREYQSILTALAHLPPRTETDPAQIAENSREKEVIKLRLARLCEESSSLRDWIQSTVEIFNGQVGHPRSFDLLEVLLGEQNYRLSFWRVAADEINYRRFFDVNELAAVCMERPEVFERAHAFVFQLLEQGLVDGLRVDHADGLYDPTSYLWQLQERRFLQLCRAEFDGSGRTGDDSDWSDIAHLLKQRFAALRSFDVRSPILNPLYLVVEKILERNERLPQNWPINGSTGYDFMNDVNGVFVAQSNCKAFDAIYAKFIGARTNLPELVYESKRLILRASMSSELHVLGHTLDRISERNRWTRDFTRHGLTQALREVIACFPVYRTYTVGGGAFRRTRESDHSGKELGPGDGDETGAPVEHGRAGVLNRDRNYVEQAVARAKRRNPEISIAVFDFVRDVLLLHGAEDLSAEGYSQRLNFIGRFQQLTGPMMAKAVEDTANYRFVRLVSLNEVGGDPERFGVSVDEFHQRNLERQAQRPLGMLATSTHDNKRSEDVRARINVLSEIPADWKSHTARWTRWNKRKKLKLEGDMAPVRNDEYLLYQTLIGTWPFEPPQGQALKVYIDRIQQYMIKAVRESKRHSSWIAPNEAYEQALMVFIEGILSDDPISAFRVDFEPFARRVAESGMLNSLAQTLLKLTSPGVPDIYQGTEIWDFSLVDPDNRREVNYESRRRTLRELKSRLKDSPDRSLIAAELVNHATDGRIKQYVHSEALGLRGRCPGLFTSGEYLPAPAVGVREEQLCAFVRKSGADAALIVVPRLMACLGKGDGALPVGSQAWGDTVLRLPAAFRGRVWRNTLTHEELTTPADCSLNVGEILRIFPVGLLEARSAYFTAPV